MKHAETPRVKKPVGLLLDGKQPDGATLIPEQEAKPLIWDMTVLEAYADSHIHDTAMQAEATADQQMRQSTELLKAQLIFFSISIETGGSWN